MQYISFYERFYELLIREPYIKNSIAVALIWVVGDIIKNDGRDWMHFEMPIRYFILVKWVYISQSIQKPSNSFQCMRNWKEFDTMVAHKIYHWDSKESNPSPLI